MPEDIVTGLAASLQIAAQRPTGHSSAQSVY
jgi:hypothetical protein